MHGHPVTGVILFGNASPLPGEPYGWSQNCHFQVEVYSERHAERLETSQCTEYLDTCHLCKRVRSAFD